MLIIKDRNEMLKRIEMILNRSDIDLDAYRREHKIPTDYTIDVVHTDGDYAFYANENGMTMAQVEDSPLELEDMQSIMKEAMKRHSTDFYTKFFRYCYDHHLNEVRVYQKAGIDRRTFSKIRKHDYKTSKDNVIALGIAMGMKHYELEDFMRSAGYALDMSDPRDLAISAYLQHGGRSIDDLDEILYGLRIKPIRQ